MLRILYIATSFPEPEKGATIYTDLAETLHEAGHEITVAVSEPAGSNQHGQLKTERGFEVLRIITGDYYDVGFIRKGMTTLKIPILMRRGIRKYLKDRVFDFILYEAPPVTNSDLVCWAGKHFGCPKYLMLKDIFPQNAVDLGIMKKNSFVWRYFAGKEKKLYQTADFIGCMSPANVKYILEHNSWIDPVKVELFPNTKRLSHEPKPNGRPMRKKFGIPDESCVFLFGGNMGRPQYLELLCETIRKFRDDQELFFLFVGRGADKHKLEQTIKENGIRNALLLDNLPRDEYEQITREIDIGLIVLDPRFTIPNYPSRILSYMEYAKPVLAATDTATDIRDLIRDARLGEWVWSGDARAFMNKVKEMSKSAELAEMGGNGREFIEKHYQVRRSAEILESHFDPGTRG